MSAREAALARRSWSKVTDDAPTDEELLALVAAAGRVADHSSLRPWRLVTLRGEDREVLGQAIARAEGERKPSSKPLRAPLLIAVVGRYRSGHKVPVWEQEAVASGVAHLLSLLLDEAGWGVIWRTGDATRSKPVARAHGLVKGEVLLGWLYVGGKLPGKRGHVKTIDPAAFVSPLPGSARTAPEPDGAKAAKKPKESKKDRKRREKREKKERKAARA